MIRLHERLGAEMPEARLLLQIHDELVIDAPAGRAEEVAKRTARVMSEAMAMSVPLKVDIGIGENWRDVK
jgi:DNA polymerase I-like protein with 3'-5' exonuclease and polymerase domains